MWVLDFRDDVESDLSALHRVDDMDAMPARRFFALVNRLGAYPGAVQIALTPVAQKLENLDLETPDRFGIPAYTADADGDTPDHVIAEMRRALISDFHGGEPIKWVDHDTLVREAQK